MPPLFAEDHRAAVEAQVVEAQEAEPVEVQAAPLPLRAELSFRVVQKKEVPHQYLLEV